MLIQSTEIFSVLTQWVVFYIVNYIMQSAMMPQWWLIYNVQWILDCFPVSVSTEPPYSHDQFAHSYSNPYKLYISDWDLKLPWDSSNIISTQ